MSIKLGDSLRTLRIRRDHELDEAYTKYGIDNLFAEAVEIRLNRCHRDWGILDPREIILEVVKEQLHRSSQSPLK